MTTEELQGLLHDAIQQDYKAYEALIDQIEALDRQIKDLKTKLESQEGRNQQQTGKRPSCMMPFAYQE